MITVKIRALLISADKRMANVNRHVFSGWLPTTLSHLTELRGDRVNFHNNTPDEAEPPRSSLMPILFTSKHVQHFKQSC